jgi:hypothetical protein
MKDAWNIVGSSCGGFEEADARITSKSDCPIIAYKLLRIWKIALIGH